MKFTASLVSATFLVAFPAFASNAAGGPVAYGRLVSGLDWSNRLGGPGAVRWRSADSQWGTSLWGMRGEVAMGGGLRSTFQLESGFDLNRGTDGMGFDRIARVGLVLPGYGELYLGRDMKLSDGELWALDPGGLQFIGAATLVHGRAWGSRARAFGYRSPVWAGWTASVQLAPGARDGASGREWSVNLRYQRGSTIITALYDAVRSNSSARAAYDDLYRRSRQYLAGATYGWRRIKIFVGYIGLRARSAKAAGDNPCGARRSDTAWAGLNWQASSALTLLGAVYHTRLDRGGGRATLAMLGANYALSKRTVLYAAFGSVFNRGRARFAVEAGGPPADAPPPGGSQQGAYAGIAHWF